MKSKKFRLLEYVVNYPFLKDATGLMSGLLGKEKVFLEVSKHKHDLLALLK